jgi:LDH2 family malate/lactate/ureidoglycolate dehydrogenase
VITRRLRQGEIVALGDNPNCFKAQADAKKNQVLVPGEKERLTMAERSETGLPLLEKMWLGICELGY